MRKRSANAKRRIDNCPRISIVRPMRSLLLFLAAPLLAAEPAPVLPGNAVLHDYFERQVAAIERRPMPLPKNAEEWKPMQAEGRRQLAGMLGLDPMPAKTPLNPVKTSEVEGDGF